MASTTLRPPRDNGGSACCHSWMHTPTATAKAQTEKARWCRDWGAEADLLERSDALATDLPLKYLEGGTRVDHDTKPTPVLLLRSYGVDDA